MSDRAIVAYPSADGPDGTYDLHYSHNGATQFYLHTVLQDYVRGNIGRGEANIVPPEQDRRREMRAEAGADLDIERYPEDTAIESEPSATGLELEELAGGFPYYEFDAFYLVRGNAVETYVPVWVFPDVLRAIVGSTSVAVYESEDVPTDPRAAAEYLDDADNMWTFNFATIPTMLDDMPGFRESLELLHEPCISMYEQLRRAAAKRGEQIPKGQVDKPPYFAEVLAGFNQDTPAVPDGSGGGFLVRVEFDDGQPVNAMDITSIAEQERVRIGEKRIRAVDDDNEEDYPFKQAYHDLTKSLAQSYRGNLAPFSPGTFGDIATNLDGD